MMNFRINSDGNVCNVNEIYEMLKEYNLNHREASPNILSAIFLKMRRAECSPD